MAFERVHLGFHLPDHRGDEVREIGPILRELFPSWPAIVALYVLRLGGNRLGALERDLVVALVERLVSGGQCRRQGLRLSGTTLAASVFRPSTAAWAAASAASAGPFGCRRRERRSTGRGWSASGRPSFGFLQFLSCCNASDSPRRGLAGGGRRRGGLDGPHRRRRRELRRGDGGSQRLGVLLPEAVDDDRGEPPAVSMTTSAKTGAAFTFTDAICRSVIEFSVCPRKRGCSSIRGP